MNTALVVEDLPDIRAWLCGLLEVAFPSIAVTCVATRSQALVDARRGSWDLALVDLGLPDGSGVDVLAALRSHNERCLGIVVTIYDDDEHLFPALQAGAFGYLLKDQPRDLLLAQLAKITQGEPPLSPAIARRVLAYFARNAQAPVAHDPQDVRLTPRESTVLQRVAKGFTLPEIAREFGLSPHTVAGYTKEVYRKLNVSSRAEAALEAARRGIVRT